MRVSHAHCVRVGMSAKGRFTGRQWTTKATQTHLWANPAALRPNDENKFRREREVLKV